MIQICNISLMPPIKHIQKYLSLSPTLPATYSVLMILLFSNGGGEINTEVIRRHIYCLDCIVEHGVPGSEPIRRGSQEGTVGGGQRVSRAA